MKTSTLFAGALSLTVAFSGLSQAMAQNVAASSATAATASSAPTVAPTLGAAKMTPVTAASDKAVVKSAGVRHAGRKASRHHRHLAQAKVTAKSSKARHGRA